jgi:predicted AAA+ superfamily ATPase
MLEIAREDIVARMAFDNPWWDDGGEGAIPFQDAPRRRYYQEFLRNVMDRTLRRATVLMGPRRVGKTVMVYQAVRDLISAGVSASKIFYISLETPIYTGKSLEKLLQLFQETQSVKRTDEAYVFFDEVQYLRNWEVHLKSLVDSYGSYRFVATGSAAAALRLKSRESGAGRFTDFILPPLTFAEYLDFIGSVEGLIEEDPEGRFFTSPNINGLNAEFLNYLNYGGYPEAVIVPSVRANPEQYIKSDIIDKVLLRDLPSLYGIDDIQELNRLFTTLAYNTGHEVSLENLSQSSGVAKNTIKRYLEYLEAAFLIKRVERIDNNAKQFKRATAFKVYLTNPSMRAALFGRVKPDSEYLGHLVETAIFSQWQHSRSQNLYYARWKRGEVDIVCLAAQQKPMWAVEVKWSDKPCTVDSELSSCIEFAKRHPMIVVKFLVTTKTLAEEKDVDGVEFKFIPSALYAYTLGANILKGISNGGRAHIASRYRGDDEE